MQGSDAMFACVTDGTKTNHFAAYSVLGFRSLEYGNQGTDRAGEGDNGVVSQIDKLGRDREDCRLDNDVNVNLELHLSCIAPRQLQYTTSHNRGRLLLM
jgi:hypothetical protein